MLKDPERIIGMARDELGMGPPAPEQRGAAGARRTLRRRAPAPASPPQPGAAQGER